VTLNSESAFALFHGLTQHGLGVRAGADVAQLLEVLAAEFRS